mgnify:CR=1 FL=1
MVWSKSILVSAIAGLLAVASFSSHASAQTVDRPNILFCFADDWGRYASIYGEIESKPSPSQVVKTPNIDRVARRGVVFRRAYVNAPSCTPCRSALLSGRYFFNTGRGAILQGAQWDSSIPSQDAPWASYSRRTYDIGRSTFPFFWGSRGGRHSTTTP